MEVLGFAGPRIISDYDFYLVMRLSFYFRFRFMRDQGCHDLNFLNVKDDRFIRVRKTLDAQMKWLTSQGYGCDTKQADPISEEQENSLWQSGTFNLETSSGILNAVFFYNCKLFGLRGRDEHYNLETSQFSIGEDDCGKFIHFVGRDNKTFKGGLAHRDVEVKNIKHIR